MKEQLLNNSDWPKLGDILKVETYDSYTNTETSFIGSVICIEKSRDIKYSDANQYSDGNIIIDPRLIMITHQLQPVPHWIYEHNVDTKITIIGEMPIYQIK